VSWHPVIQQGEHGTITASQPQYRPSRSAAGFLSVERPARELTLGKNFFRNLSVQSKVTVLILGIAAVILLLFFSLSIMFQTRTMKNAMVADLAVLARSIGDQEVGSTALHNYESIDLLLGILKENKDIERGVVYHQDMRVFAVFGQDSSVSPVPKPPADGRPVSAFFRSDSTYRLGVLQPIDSDQGVIGYLYVVSNLASLKTRLLKTSLFLGGVMGLLLVATYLVARRLQRTLYEPLFKLANTAREITEFGDYSVRVDRSRKDEIGNLVGNFNTMLEAIQARDNELHQHRHNLELLVEERTEELRKRRDEAVASAQAKAEFLANMSHEIRTPMNGVIGVISLLQDAPLPDEYRRLLGTAIKSADSVMYVINDILDFSKIDAGILEFEAIPFDLRELLDETVSLFVDAVNTRKLDITSFIPLDVHCFVEGDPARLRQILNNLVNNAVKFTPVGQIVLKVEHIETQGDKQLLRFSVSDSGIGIAEKVLPSLFEKFTQADGSTTRQYGGTGLGLNVCKQLVELQGGDIGVYSQEGEGSEFWFTLQLAMTPVSEIPTICRGLEGKRILVVDDNTVNMEVIEHYLSPCNVSVSSFKSGRYALRFLEENVEAGRPIDMVLIDHYMPEMDGPELATRIREEYGRQAPELFMLSSGSLGAQKAFLAGFKDVIYKPVRLNQLYDTLAGRAISRAKSLEERYQSQQVPMLQGRVLLVDDEPINRKVARAILEKLGLETETALNGRKAVELLEKSHYDVVLMDLQMPEMDGYEATEYIRSREGGTPEGRVTIIAMTANALESTRAKCLAVGMDDYISKPIKPEALAERLRPYLGGPGTTVSPGGGTTAASEHETGQQDMIWDPERSLQFVGGDKELLVDLTRIFLERNEVMLQNLEDSIQSRDPARLDDAAHTYKDAVNHFWAEPIRDIALELEMKGKDGDTTGAGELLARLESLSQTLVLELNKFIESGQADGK
jgi:signal transduction histidine kinase/DNA-binding response OmpR family regulator